MWPARCLLGERGDQTTDASQGAALRNSIVLRDISRRTLGRAEFNDFERDAFLLRLRPQSRATEDEHGRVNRKGGFDFRYAAARQPAVLLLKKGLEFIRKRGVVELTLAVATQVPVQSLGQAGQHHFH